MDESTLHLVKNALGAGVRWVLLLAAGALVKKGIISNEEGQTYIANSTPVLVGAIMAVITLLWSLYQKKKANDKVDLALALPATTDRAELEKKVDAGVKPAIAPFILLPILIFAQACSPDEIRKGAKTASVGITTLRGLRDTNASLLTRGKITKEESDVNVRLMQEASSTIGQLNDQVRFANDRVNAIDAQLLMDPNNEELKRQRAEIVKSASQNLRPLVKSVGTVIRNLNDQGILRVKNLDARAQLSDLMGVLLDLL